MLVPRISACRGSGCSVMTVSMHKHTHTHVSCCSWRGSLCSERVCRCAATSGEHCHCHGAIVANAYASLHSRAKQLAAPNKAPNNVSRCIKRMCRHMPRLHLSAAACTQPLVATATTAAAWRSVLQQAPPSHTRWSGTHIEHVIKAPGVLWYFCIDWVLRINSSSWSCHHSQ